LKLAAVKFRLPMEHPGVGGHSRSSAVNRSSERDNVPACVIERIDQSTVSIACEGKTRLYTWAQVLWADPLAQVQQPGLQKSGKR
jgi:hypothetical protein